MFFQIDPHTTDIDLVSRALKQIDAFAQVTHEPDTGRMEVVGDMSASQALAALQQAGVAVQPLEDGTHVSGGSTCCGGCH